MYFRANFAKMFTIGILHNIFSPFLLSQIVRILHLQQLHFELLHSTNFIPKYSFTSNQNQNYSLHKNYSNSSIARKLMGRSKEINQIWTRGKGTEIQFSVIFGCLNQTFISGRETGQKQSIFIIEIQVHLTCGE